MSAPTRREFLARSAALGAAALLPRFALGQAAAPQAATAPATTLPPDMTIARWGGTEVPTDLPVKLVREALGALGGMGRFVQKQAVVWVKPNIGWNRKPEFAANTDPQVVGEIVRLCFEAGAKTVKVGDFTCNEARACYENSGIAPAARAAGAQIVYLDKSRFRDMTIGGRRLKEHPVYPEIVECDLVVNVPVCKHHGSTQVTLAMKNYMGVVENRGFFHQDLPTTIADITRFMKPRLSILDAVRVLTARGPTGGRLEDVKTFNTVAASVDIVALDAFGSELLGHDPAKIGTVAMGAEYELGRMDYRALQLKELQVA
ncbi:MAG: DUF362 domain-containing protein [Phycisphaerales bacterium]|nr:DUF362 domain-containing protein [Phycisphaerales bacterium]